MPSDDPTNPAADEAAESERQPAEGGAPTSASEVSKPGQTAPKSEKKKKPQKQEDGEPAWVQEVRTLAIFVLTFLVGSVVTYTESFPYEPLLREAFDSMSEAADYLYLTNPSLMSKEHLNFWGKPLTDETGVTIHEKDKAFQGYTLYTSGHTRGAYLLNMDGEVVHEWSYDFEKAFPKADHVPNYKLEWLVYWRRVHMMPNGDMIAQYYGGSDTPYGYGLIKVDKDSKLIWKSDLNVHHDFDIAPDGTIWTIDHEFRKIDERPIKGVTHLAGLEILDDNIVAFDQDGKLLRKINVYDALVSSPFSHIATLTKPDYPKDTDWDPLHTNGVAYIGPEFASHHDYAEPGDVMVSIRRTDTLLILDVETERVKWASRGFHSHQHDPDPLPNGNVMIYDNRGHAGVEGTSRIVEFNPTTNAIVWWYVGSAERPFESEIRSNQQVLPNDNVLTCEHKTGRILEVTRAGEIVWEFHSPHREDGNVAGVGSVMRYPSDYLQFEPRNRK